VLDTAKILTLRGLEHIEDAFERRIPLHREMGLIAVPTTCGTGSEVTNIAITEFTDRKIKLGLADDTLFPDHAVLIPELLRDLPYSFYLFSSIDALIHAMESWVSPRSNAMTQMFSREAIRLILEIYGNLATDGEAYRFERLSDMLRASTAAGVAFGNTGVGAVHALSYPLGGKYHVPHGESNYLFFTTIFRHYLRREPDGKIRDLNRFLADCMHCPESDVYEVLENLLGRLIACNPLRHYGMHESEIETFADSVLEKQQRLLANNYVPLSRDEIRTLYRTLY
jgi:4-hydroxybutyrate dehydrogenase